MELLDEVRAQLKARTYRPVPARERMIPKPGGKKRRLGIPTITDRLVQAGLKLVSEPIFEAGFDPCSYGFRPNRCAQDAIAEIHHLGTLKYHWVLEADIEACFDSIDHSALMQRLRQRIGDKRVLALVKAFLKAGVLSEHGQRSNTLTGTPQGGILSPLLANIALLVLDEHFTGQWQQMMATPTQRQRRRRHGQANWRLIRYADDFVVMVHGPRGAAEGLRDQVAAVLAPLGLGLAEVKTQVVHIDEGFDFLGFRIQRYRKQGSHKRYVCTFPARRAVDSVKQKVKALTRRTPSGTLRKVLGRNNAILRGWTNYFKHGVSKRVFSYLKSYTEIRLARLLRTRHRRLRWKDINRRYVNNHGVIVAEGW